MSSRTSDLISPKASVGMIRRGADLIKREDENCQCELPSRRARQDGIENLIELAVIPDGPSRLAAQAQPTVVSQVMGDGLRYSYSEAQALARRFGALPLPGSPTMDRLLTSPRALSGT